MKKLLAALMILAVAFSLAACGGDGDKEPEASSSAPENTVQAAEAPVVTEAPTEVSMVATGNSCTITVPKLETFFNGYQGTTVKYNNPEPHMTVYVNLYGEDSNLEVNISVTQVYIHSAETQDAKGYAEYYNSTSKSLKYEPVEIAGYSGYLAEKFIKSSLTTDRSYMIDYPLSDGTSVVISLWVTQKYNEDTKDMTPVAEAFLKNIQVAPINA